MENKKRISNKKLSQKKKAEIERDALKAKLLENYVEGESNLDYQQLSFEELGEIGFPFYNSVEEREQILGRKLP